MTLTSRITIQFKRPYNPHIALYSTELSWKDKYINLMVCKAIFFVISWRFEKYKLLKASKQIWRQTNIKVLLQQVLDSVLSNDPKNDVSEEKSSEEELDYHDIVKNRIGSQCSFLAQILLPPLHQTSPFYLVALATYLFLQQQIMVTWAILSWINTIKYIKSPYHVLKLKQVLKSCFEFILRFLPKKFSEIFFKMVQLIQGIGILYNINFLYLKVLYHFGWLHLVF